MKNKFNTWFIVRRSRLGTGFSTLLTATLVSGSVLAAPAGRPQQITPPVAMDGAAARKAAATPAAARAALPAVPPEQAGVDPAMAAALADAGVARSLPAIAAAERARKDAATAAVQRHGFLADYEDPDGISATVVDITPSGIPLFAKDMSLTGNTFDGTDLVWGNWGLDGTDRMVGVFEIGSPRSTHLDFIIPGTSDSRLILRDAPLPVLSDHASAVCGIVGGLGVLADAQGDTSQGASWNAPIHAWLINDEFQKMNGLALDELRAHNHSYGLSVGWDQLTVGGAYMVRIWFGDIRVSTAESAMFGRYTTLSSDTDAVVRNRPWTLPVWSAGNDRAQAAAGNTITVMRNGVNMGSGYWVTYRSPAAGQAVVAGVFNGTQFWPLAGAAWSASLPAVVTLPAATQSVAVAGTPGPDGGAAGYDCVPDGYGVAKNALTVGAMDNTAGSNVIASFSACGPVDDGRIKPDVVDAGVAIVAANSQTDDGGAYWSGTSMAAPQVTGAVNLVAQLQEQTWTALHPLVASTYKALVIHTADDMGTAGPDYTFGWGRVNAANAASHTESNFYSQQRIFIKEVDLVAPAGSDNGDSEFLMKAVGGAPVCVTAAWTDPVPAAVQPDTLDPSDRMVVNNIDVDIYKMNGTYPNLTVGTRYYPWRLNPASPATAATRTLADTDNAAKDRNNVEQVKTPVNATANSWYKVVVRKKTTGAAGSPFVGDANGRQRVSIVLSGVKERTVGSEWLYQVTAQTYTVLNGQVVAQLTWNSIPGETYRIEFSPDLVNWVDACGGAKYLSRKDSTTAVTVPVVNLGPSGFFRVATVAPNPFGL